MVTMREVLAAADHVYTSPAQVPKLIRNAILACERSDVLTPMERGKEWAYELMAQTQPRTAKLLLAGGEFIMVVHEVSGGEWPFVAYLVQEVNGQVVQIARRFRGYNPSDEGFVGNQYAWMRPLSLPEAIRMAWYYRIDSLSLPRSPNIGAFPRVLPYPVDGPWESIDGYLSIVRLKKTLLPLVEEMIPGIRPPRKDLPYTKFMMFLNSWGSFIGKKRSDGDHLFVKPHIRDGVVYYIRDADVAGMTILADPVEAVDRYCEHVLLRKEERFDFRPWAVPFVSPSV